MWNYADSVQYLYSLGNELKAVKFGLGQITTILEKLGNPQDCFRTIHVAGTNGKGSTCAMLESSLRQAGFKTGLYTSPHLMEPVERIQVNGEPVTPEQFSEAFDVVHRAAEALIVQGKLRAHPTYFETVTAMAFLLFRDASVDVAVIEVGLGGRLDATNVIRPELCLITPIDFDHEQWLGNTIEAIASEKAGIMKPGTPVVFAAQRPEAEAVLIRRAQELRCPVSRFDDFPVSEVQVHRFGSRFCINGLCFECPLPGEHQVENARTAIVALRALQVDWGSIRDGIASVKWPGRLERARTSPDLILDGAHNPAGARALVRYIEAFHSDRRVWLIYGAMRDKSVQEVTELLFAVADAVLLVAPDNPRALSPEGLLILTEHENARTAGTLRTALDEVLRDASPDDSIFVTGSLYLVGEARKLLVQ